MISSYVGENAEFERQYLSGELEVELTPQVRKFSAFLLQYSLSLKCIFFSLEMSLCKTGKAERMLFSRSHLSIPGI